MQPNVRYISDYNIQWYDIDRDERDGVSGPNIQQTLCSLFHFFGGLPIS